MNNPFAWVEIYVSDMQRARRFYEAVLQVSLTDMKMPDGMDQDMEMFAFPSDMNWPGCSGALVKMAGMDARWWGSIVYFGCEDCGIELSRVVWAWGIVHQEKMSIGEYGFMWLAVDTEGNMVWFYSMQ